MNNRIKELAERAADYCKTQPREMAGSMWEEKFAELIVRECSMLYQSIDNGNRPHGTDDYLTALKLHLGIKE
jgi:hypothetical protein